MVWRASPRHYVTTTLLQVGSGVGVVVQLLVARRILQDLLGVSEGEAVSSLYTSFGLLVGVIVTLGCLGALAAHRQRLLIELVGRYAFDRIIGVATMVKFSAFESPDFYDQLQRARTSGDFRIIDMVNGLTSLTTALFTTIGIGAVLFVLEPLLLGFAVLAAVPGLLAAVHNSQKNYAFEYAMTPESRERAYVVELLTGRDTAKEVRLFELGAFLRRRYEALTETRLGHLRTFLQQRLRVTLLATLAGGLGMAIAFGALVALLADDRIGVAAALTAGLALQQLGARLPVITGSIARLIESGMFIDDYTAFLALPSAGETAASPEPSDTSASKGVPVPFSGLSVEEVSFAYPGAGRAALQGVSLEVRPGEIVALVGENGSGKTTLVKLICQLYEPQSGRILWNGIDATNLPAAEIRSEITVLFQDFIQYHLSALDNIAFGRIARPPNLEDAIAAATRAGADEFLSELPHGYDTRLGLQFYGGHELSVGQWQRLALARAFFREGSFLILDEPTASLDPRAERDLFAQMRQLAAGRSVLLISHRFSSVRSADRIYVLERGRLTEAGSHTELIEKNGHYADLFNMQAAAYLGQKPTS